MLECIKDRNLHNLSLEGILYLEVYLVGFLSKNSGTIGQQLKKAQQYDSSNDVMVTSLK